MKKVSSLAILTIREIRNLRMSEVLKLKKKDENFLKESEKELVRRGYWVKKQVYGMLELKNGTEVDLDGQTIQEVLRQKKFKKSEIIGYGQKQIGNKANIYVVENGIGYEVRGLKNVKNLFS